VLIVDGNDAIDDCAAAAAAAVAACWRHTIVFFFSFLLPWFIHLSMSMNFRLYAIASVAVAIGVVLNATATHQQFYTACRHLMTSKISQVVWVTAAVIQQKNTVENVFE
jgi:hypothetical protein